jgi:hypothetical protein
LHLLRRKEKVLMRHAFFVALLFSISLAAPAQAQDSPSRISASHVPIGRVQLVEEVETGALQVLLDGKGVARCLPEKQRIACEVVAPDVAVIVPGMPVPGWNRSKPEDGAP